MSQKTITETKQKNLLEARPLTEKDISLFNDPRWGSARQNMTKDQLEHYQTIGSQMNGSIDFLSGESNPIPIPEPVETSLAYIEIALRSGLDSSDLSNEEIELLENFCGKNWKSKFSLDHESHDNKNTQES